MALTILIAPALATSATPTQLVSSSFRSTPAMEDEVFGREADVDQGTAVIGAPGAEGFANGTTQVWIGGGSEWTYHSTLEAIPAPASWDGFGLSVAISGDNIAVGAPFDSGNASQAGAAYIFERSNTLPVVWFLQSSHDAVPASTLLGRAVAIDGDVAVFGGREVALVFERDEGGADNWGLVATLTPSDTTAEIEFGTSVAVVGSWIAVGAPLADTDGSGSEFNSGAVYLFNRNEGGSSNWGETNRLEESVPTSGAFFGLNVRLASDGAGLTTHRLAANSSDAISTYFRTFLGGVWTFDAEVTLGTISDPGGSAIALEGSSLVVGRNPTFGAEAYLFEREAGQWNEKLRYEALNAGEDFAAHVALDSAGSMLFTAPNATVVGTNSAGRVWAIPLAIFVDGFERGDTSEWSATTP